MAPDFPVPGFQRHPGSPTYGLLGHLDHRRVAGGSDLRALRWLTSQPAWIPVANKNLDEGRESSNTGEGQNHASAWSQSNLPHRTKTKRSDRVPSKPTGSDEHLIAGGVLARLWNPTLTSACLLLEAKLERHGFPYDRSSHAESIRVPQRAESMACMRIKRNRWNHTKPMGAHGAYVPEPA